MKLRILACLTLSFSTHLHAARPFVTDDARLTTAGSCQMESWARHYPDSQETWALPACNPTGNLEFTLGGGAARYDNANPSHDYVFQAKTLLKPLESNGWGWGLAAGTVQHPSIHPGPNILGNTYAYIPASISFDDEIILHTNLGWIKDKSTGRDSATWGIGGEFKLTPKLLGIAESYGDDQGTAYSQVGFRYSVIPDLFQLDATLGHQLSGDNKTRWISFGLRYTPDSFF